MLLILLMAVSAAAQTQPAQPPAAKEEKPMDLQKAHEYFSADCFNKCWNYIDMATRTAGDTENMLLAANASLWHWKQRTDVQPLNLSIAYWQLSRVYALAGLAEMADRYAKQCEQVTIPNNLPPFYAGYAFEALARSALISKDSDAARKHLSKAEEYAAQVSAADEKGLLDADLKQLSAMMAKDE